MRLNYLWLIIPPLCAGIFLVSCQKNDYDQEAAFSKIKSQLELLELNEEQAALLKPIFTAQLAKAKTILEEEKGKRPERPPDFGGRPPDFSAQKRPENPIMLKLQEVTKEAESELRSILTAEQLSKYNELLKEEVEELFAKNRPRHNKMGGPPGGGQGMPGPGPNW